MSCLRKKEALQRLAEVRDVVKHLPEEAKTGRMFVEKKWRIVILREGIEAAADAFQKLPEVQTSELMRPFICQFKAFAAGNVTVYSMDAVGLGMRRLEKETVLGYLDGMRRIVEKLPEDVEIIRLFIVDDGQGMILDEGIEKAAEACGKESEVVADLAATQCMKVIRFYVGDLGVYQTGWK